MKNFLLIAFLILSFNIFASTPEMESKTVKCSEFSFYKDQPDQKYQVNAIEAYNFLLGKPVYDSDVSAMVSMSTFKIPKDVGTFLGCPVQIYETSEYDNELTTLNLNKIESDNKVCTYDNRGLSPMTYGFVCEKF